MESPSGSERFVATTSFRRRRLGALVSALDPAMPNEALSQRPASATATSSSWRWSSSGNEVFRDNWIYVHSPDVRVGRIQNFKNWSAAMVPTPHTTCLGAEYFCFEGDDSGSADATSSPSVTRSRATGSSSDRGRRRTVFRIRKAYTNKNKKKKQKTNKQKKCSGVRRTYRQR